MTLERRKPLAPGKPLSRGKPLERTGFKARSFDTPPKKKRAPRKPDIPKSVRAKVAARSEGYCEARSQVCIGVGQQMHHRLMRSQGGLHSTKNLLHVCHPCHTFIHANTGFAYEQGWLLHRLA